MAVLWEEKKIRESFPDLLGVLQRRSVDQCLLANFPTLFQPLVAAHTHTSGRRFRRWLGIDSLLILTPLADRLEIPFQRDTCRKCSSREPRGAPRLRKR
jgi:hypothetical protein